MKNLKPVQMWIVRILVALLALMMVISSILPAFGF